MTGVHELVRHFIMARPARIVRPHENLVDEKNMHENERFRREILLYPG